MVPPFATSDDLRPAAHAVFQPHPAPTIAPPVRFRHERPFDSPLPVVGCAASVLGAIGAAASFLWEQRAGAAQPVTVSRATPAPHPPPLARGHHATHPATMGRPDLTHRTPPA